MIKAAVLLLVWIGFAVGGGIVVPRALQADFYQKITDADGRVARYEGKMAMNFPDRIKWSYLRPARKEVCTSGSRVLVVDHELEQATLYHVGRSLDLGKILRSARHHKGRIWVATVAGKYYTLQIDSKGRIDQIAFKDDDGNVVNIHFRKIRYLSRPLDPKTLYCPVPAGYDRVGG
ncbi:LolA-like outer membrane lipoprotein chaperone [Nitratifractor sp.]